MVDKKDREAYKRGQKERRDQENPLWYLAGPSRHKGNSKSEREAFKKGVQNEQLDE